MKLVDEVSEEKIRGGFYTPKPLAEFILSWASNGEDEYDILEPSCGDGAFLEVIKESEFEYNSITAIEAIEEEAEKARSIDLPNTDVQHKDFLNYCSLTGDRYDLVVGNPPYIRYHYFPEEQQLKSEKLFERAGLEYSRLSNAWASFVIGSSLLIKQRGKFGMVLPAELLQVSHAEPIREFLSNFYNKITIISFEKLVFSDIEQEIVLLLSERDGSDTHRIDHIEVSDVEGLNDLDVTKLKSPKKKIDPTTDKWTFYFLSADEVDFLEELRNKEFLSPLSEFASVQVGMTTGYNKFFTVKKETVEEYNLQDYAKKMVGRSIQVPSLIFTDDDWKNNIDQGRRAYFLKFPPKDSLKDSRGALQYIEWGEDQGFHDGYKTGKRDEWQVVPSTWVSDALFTRRNNIYPKLVLNLAEAYTTDTMHRVKIKDNINPKSLIASYYNSVSLAFAEISGRSHGNGALELMPNEAERIQIPYKEVSPTFLDELDEMLRSGEEIDDIVSKTDEVLLKGRVGLTDEDIHMAPTIWKKFSDRRLNRNGSA
jgi:adenine-specific DNA methylase